MARENGVSVAESKRRRMLAEAHYAKEGMQPSADTLADHELYILGKMDIQEYEQYLLLKHSQNAPKQEIKVSDTATMNTVGKDRAVEIHYTLTNSKGDIVDSSRNASPLPYLHGHENLVPGLEKALEGKKVGDVIQVSVSPDEGYGERSPALTQSVPRSMFQFDGDIEVGMRFEAEAAHGIELVTVVAVDDDMVTIDANHPLAGETLNFDVEIMSVRDATAEEMEHGHVHGEGGCGH